MQQYEEVRSVIEKANKITVLTGAGASTESGIQIFAQQMDYMQMRM